MRRPRAGSRSTASRSTEHTPEAAKRAGIGMIFQEMSLVPTLTAAQNIFLNNETKDGARLHRRQDRAQRRARELFETLGVEIDPKAAGRRSLGRAAPAHRDRQGDLAQRARAHSRRADDRALRRRGREAVRLPPPAQVRGRGDHLRLAPHGRDHADRRSRHDPARRPARRHRADERTDARQDHRVYRRPPLARLLRRQAPATPRAARRSSKSVP